MKKMTFLLSVLLMGAVSCSGSDYNSETTDNENSTTDERIDLNGKKILIAYWSWSGNTEAVAQEIQRQAGGDLYPMQPLVPYGTTYQEVAYGGRTKDEADNDLRPALADTLSTVGQYDVIFIGTPVWWHMEARLVDTFCDLYANELRGRLSFRSAPLPPPTALRPSGASRAIHPTPHTQRAISRRAATPVVSPLGSAASAVVKAQISPQAFATPRPTKASPTTCLTPSAVLVYRQPPTGC